MRGFSRNSAVNKPLDPLAFLLMRTKNAPFPQANILHRSIGHRVLMLYNPKDDL